MAALWLMLYTVTKTRIFQRVSAFLLLLISANLPEQMLSRDTTSGSFGRTDVAHAGYVSAARKGKEMLHWEAV